MQVINFSRTRMLCSVYSVTPVHNYSISMSREHARHFRQNHPFCVSSHPLTKVFCYTKPIRSFHFSLFRNRICSIFGRVLVDFKLFPSRSEHCIFLVQLVRKLLFFNLMSSLYPLKYILLLLPWRRLKSLFCFSMTCTCRSP